MLSFQVSSQREVACLFGVGIGKVGEGGRVDTYQWYSRAYCLHQVLSPPRTTDREPLVYLLELLSQSCHSHSVHHSNNNTTIGQIFNLYYYYTCKPYYSYLRISQDCLNLGMSLSKTGNILIIIHIYFTWHNWQLEINWRYHSETRPLAVQLVITRENSSAFYLH